MLGIQDVDYAYDRLGRVIEVKEGGSTAATYEYDKNGNVVSETKAGGVATEYTYNAANLLTNKTNRNSSGSLVAEYAYSYYLDGNIRSENDKTYTYDLQGRLKADNMGSYEYDRFGNRSRRWHGPEYGVYIR